MYSKGMEKFAITKFVMTKILFYLYVNLNSDDT